MALRLVEDSLKIGIKLAGEVQKDFKVRGATMADVLAAEDLQTPEKPYHFAMARLCQQLVAIGSFQGPFTVELLSRLKPADFRILRDAMDRADALGELELAPEPPA